MIIQCPECGSRYRLGDDRASGDGVQVRCTSCNTVFHAQESAAAEAPGSSRARILVCDDAPFFRTMLEDILGSADFDVEAVESGEAALAAIEASVPDLLVLDLQLPGMSGFDVIKTIRGGVLVPTLPILAMSAVYTDSADVMDLEDIGANDYIGKKFKPDHLVKRIRRLLGSKD